MKNDWNDGQINVFIECECGRIHEKNIKWEKKSDLYNTKDGEEEYEID